LRQIPKRVAHPFSFDLLFYLKTLPVNIPHNRLAASS